MQIKGSGDTVAHPRCAVLLLRPEMTHRGCAGLRSALTRQGTRQGVRNAWVCPTGSSTVAAWAAARVQCARRTCVRCGLSGLEDSSLRLGCCSSCWPACVPLGAFGVAAFGEDDLSGSLMRLLDLLRASVAMRLPAGPMVKPWRMASWPHRFLEARTCVCTCMCVCACACVCVCKCE